MSDFRHNPLTDQWVIIAENRLGRPNEFRQVAEHLEGKPCPFCFGNEEQTPETESLFFASPDNSTNGHWQVRVFPNKFPALLPGDCGDDQSAGPYRKLEAGGVHEIIVESPEHVTSLTEINPLQLDLSFKMYRERLACLRRSPHIRHGMLFKNCRPEAGASIEHAHSQLIGTPIIPPGVAQRVDRSRAYYEQHRRSLFQSMLDFELASGERIVSKTEQFVAFCPYASRLPYEVWIFQLSPVTGFDEFDDATTSELGRLVNGVLRQFERALDNPAYNFLFHIPPFDISSYDYYQMHIESFPRLTKTAGYEWGTGCMINPVSPERAAEQLRFDD